MTRRRAGRYGISHTGADAPFTRQSRVRQASNPVAKFREHARLLAPASYATCNTCNALQPGAPNHSGIL